MSIKAGTPASSKRGSEPLPLRSDEMAAWFAFIKVATRGLDRLDRELQAEHGLSLADYEILVGLSEAPERRLQMTELAAFSLLSQSRLTYRVDRLETRGLVERLPCAEDGRRIWACLTPDGLAKLKAAYPSHLADVRRFIVDPPARRDLHAVRRSMEAMLAALDES